MADDLSAPLGKKKHSIKGLSLKLGAREWPLTGILFAVSGLIISAFVVQILLVDDPEGGQPVVEVPISSTLNSNPVAQQVGTSPEQGLTIISGDENAPKVIVVEQEQFQEENTQRERTDFGVYPELMEQTQNGPIPRIGPNGQSPFVAYARPSIGIEAAAGQPLIAVIITGMGLNQSATLDAIANLPDNFTLAFAPYARTIERTAAAARAGGHEILLEVPMEPFDYPNSDPGPHTLLTGNPAKVNLDRLFWLMSRMGGYTGMINNMGARFTSSATDLSPFMEELGARGIGFIDDGSSNRSLSRQLAGANQVHFARADIALDTNPSRAAILGMLNELEDKARQEGSAIGVISALPVSISSLISWAAQLEEKGILLVPASALMDN
ncbi:MAG: divergent polysaccharide deacetylase family protein [Devosiaceae bacterium]|nr:divergent polysaccharide deacetylase family protein [Devosiaceae bacterium]